MLVISYWVTAILLFAVKCFGLINVSWFWASFMILLPMYVVAAVLVVALVVASCVEIKEKIKELKEKKS